MATETEPQEWAKINFNVLQVEQTPIGRAALEDACNTLNYFRYTDGALTNSLTQLSTEEGFGSFSDEMPWGTHELYFIGHKNELTSFENDIASFDRVGDTFSHYISLIVDGETDTNQTFTLGRRVAKFELMATDAIPEDLSEVIVTATGGSTQLNVKTGKGGAVMEQQKTVVVPETALGKTEQTFALYLFLPDGVNTVDINMLFQDAEGNEIVDLIIEDVSVKTNYITRYKGRVFGADQTFSITADTEWIATEEVEF